MIRPLTLTAFALLLALPLAARAADPIRFTSSAEVEVTEANARGEKVLIRKPADKVPPGGVVIYVNTFSNTGKEPRENLVVTSPIPASTEYIPGSAEGMGADVAFSVDGGKSFAPPAALTVIDPKLGKRPAAPSEYTHVRWMLREPLKPGASGIVEFRVRVK